jgi:hypothetical protein
MHYLFNLKEYAQYFYQFVIKFEYFVYFCKLNNECNNKNINKTVKET